MSPDARSQGPGAGTIRLQLAVTGLLLAACIALASQAAAAGVAPAGVAFAATFGGGLLLAGYCRLHGSRPPIDPRHLRTYAVMGAISSAVPTLVTAISAPRIGAGMTALVGALTPLMTLGLAVLVGIERLDRTTALGILAGLGGMALLAGAELGPAPVAWLALALLIPACNAIGNLLRARLVPVGTPRPAIAAGILLAAALAIAPFAAAVPLAALPVRGWALLAVMAAATAAFNVALLRLQTVGGPVRLSQVGYVAAFWGLAGGVLLFGEAVTVRALLAGLLIAAGVAGTTRRIPSPVPRRKVPA